MAREGLGDAELDRAKNQIRGAVLLGLDSMSGRMTRLAKSLLYYDRIIPVSEVVEKIIRVTADEARRVAQEVFGSGQFAYAAIGPLEDSGGGDD
jgi:predicted Zn-dependent peptidase